MHKPLFDIYCYRVSGLASSLALGDKRMGGGEKEEEKRKGKESDFSFLSLFPLPFLPLPFVYHQERDLKQVHRMSRRKDSPI